MERAWVYARIPFYKRETEKQLQRLMEKAQDNDCLVVGYSLDVHRGWIRRPGLWKMRRHIRRGEVDRLYIDSIGVISHRWCHLISFFKEMTDCGVIVQTSRYNLRYVANCRGIGHGIESRAIAKGLYIPWN